jgi:hypothetical protein
VLTDGSKWSVERLPARYRRQGGWVKASSDKFLDNNRASGIAWNASTSKLYVLQYYKKSTNPMLFKLG